MEEDIIADQAQSGADQVLSKKQILVIFQSTNAWPSQKSTLDLANWLLQFVVEQEEAVAAEGANNNNCVLDLNSNFHHIFNILNNLDLKPICEISDAAFNS